MQTLVFKIQVPNGVKPEIDALNLSYYETPDKYVSIRCPVEIIPRPTDENITEWAELTTVYDSATQHRIDAAKWMRSQIFGDSQGGGTG